VGTALGITIVLAGVAVGIAIGAALDRLMDLRENVAAPGASSVGDRRLALTLRVFVYAVSVIWFAGLAARAAIVAGLL
jgi:hypothetical protein